MTEDVVDSRVGHEPSDRGVRTPSIVELDVAAKGVEAIAVRSIRPGIGPLVDEGLDEALIPYIVLARGSVTDGAVAGEPNAMVALRWAADQPVAWHRQGVPAIAGHGAARLGRAGRGPLTAGRGAMARSLDLRVTLGTGLPPLAVGRGHLMDICGSIAHMGQVPAAAWRVGWDLELGSSEVG